MNLNFAGIVLLLIFMSFFSCNKTTKNDPVIDNTSPECLLKKSSSFSQGNKGGGGMTTIYNYNNDNKLISYFEIEQNDTTKYTYQENRNNLDSDINPYMVKYVNGLLLTKYFCDKNGKVIRREIFSNPKGKFPTTTIFSEYDSKNYLIKSTQKDQNSTTGEFTGDYYINEFEYSEGSISKWYTSSFVNKKNSERHLFYQYIISKIPIKTKISYFCSFGESDKFYPEQAIKFNGNSTSKGMYVYQFNANGFLLSSEIIFSDGTLSKEFGYIYQCK